MTLQEAINSGKNFKRPNHLQFHELNEWFKGYTFDKEDILATDWEVEEEKLEITQHEIHSMLVDATNGNLRLVEYYENQFKKGKYK